MPGRTGGWTDGGSLKAFIYSNYLQTIETLERDLYSLRGLAAQLDSSKDKMQLELANKDALCQQLGKVLISQLGFRSRARDSPVHPVSRPLPRLGLTRFF